jgi:hypothetical protein
MQEVEKIFVLPKCGNVQSDQTGFPDILPGNESPVYFLRPPLLKGLTSSAVIWDTLPICPLAQSFYYLFTN